MVSQDWDSATNLAGVPVTVREALDALLGRNRTGDYKDDLIAAAREAMERRKRNSEHGGAILGALRDNVGLTWREIADVTGIPASTAYRWAEPPGAREAGDPDPPGHPDSSTS